MKKISKFSVFSLMVLGMVSSARAADLKLECSEIMTFMRTPVFFVDAQTRPAFGTVETAPLTRMRFDFARGHGLEAPRELVSSLSKADQREVAHVDLEFNDGGCVFRPGTVYLVCSGGTSHADTMSIVAVMGDGSKRALPLPEMVHVQTSKQTVESVSGTQTDIVLEVSIDSVSRTKTAVSCEAL